MAWWTGKTDIVGISLGDSNMVGSGGFELGVQTFNTHVQCYATTATIPYDIGELEWRTLDPNGTSRNDQMLETLLDDTTYIGQVLGGNGNAAMQMASTVQQGTDAETFWLYQGAQGGTTAYDWAFGDNWTTMLAELPAALTAVPGSPTYADIIYISLGANDALGIFSPTYTPDEFYTNFSALRSQMISEGWWVPGTTQILLGDLPQNGVIPGSWVGLDYVRARLNDRIALVSGYGLAIQPDFIDVHYTPASLTTMGRTAGEMVIDQIPWQQSVFSVGGTRLSVGGQKLRVHSP